MSSSRKVGRKRRLTPEMQARMVEIITATGCDKDAFELTSVPEGTFYRWLQQGESQPSGIYHEFREAIQRAKAARRAALVATIRRASREPRHWTAAAWLLERTEPKLYGLRVRLQVDEELDDAIERLRRALPPDEFERALAALSNAAGAEGGAAPGGATVRAGVEEHPDRGELPAAPPELEAGAVPSD